MPQKIDLSKMNLVELEELRKNIDKAMENTRKAARKRALEDVQKVAQKHGFSLGELVDGKSKRLPSKPKAAPKYRNPNNPSDTWSGSRLRSNLELHEKKWRSDRWSFQGLARDSARKENGLR